MAERIAETLTVGSRFSYDYDFSTATELEGRVLELVPGKQRGPAIEVVARNEPPVHPCAECGQNATTLCALCNQGAAIRAGTATPAASIIAAATQASTTSSPSSTRLGSGSAATTGRPRADSRPPEAPTPVS